MKEKDLNDINEYLKKVPDDDGDICFICFRSFKEARALERKEMPTAVPLQCMTYKLSRPVCSRCYSRFIWGRDFNDKKEAEQIKQFIEEIQATDEVAIWGSEGVGLDYYFPNELGQYDEDSMDYSQDDGEDED